MGLIFIFMLACSLFQYNHATDTVIRYNTVFNSDHFTAKCKSSGQIAIWSWYGKASVVGKTLAAGASKHKRLKDER